MFLFFGHSFRWKSHFYRGKLKRNTHMTWLSVQRHRRVFSNTVSFSARFIDRPEQRISLEDFKNFLLESQMVTSSHRCSLSWICFIFPLHHVCACVWIQEMWASDGNKVQEFMFSYLKDPLREVEQPYFHQDEVPPLWPPPSPHPFCLFALCTCFCTFIFPMQPAALLASAGDAQKWIWIAVVSA